MKTWNAANHPALLVFLFFAALYALTMNGYIANTDAESMYQVTRSIVDDHDLAIEGGLVRQLNGRAGSDGRFYAWYGIGQSLIGIPFYLAGKCLAIALPAGQREFLLRFCTVATNAVVAAGWVAMVFRLALLLWPDRQRALLAALAFGAGTFVWPYSKLFFSEPATGFFLAACAEFAIRARRCGRAGEAWVAGLALAGAILVRPQVVLLAPLIAAFAAGFGRKASLNIAASLRQGMAATLPAGAAVLLAGWYNWARFGSPFDAGLPSVLALGHLPVGLYGFLFSSGKSLFVYAPLAVLACLGFPSFARRFPGEAALMAVIAVLYVLPGAASRDWGGGVCWGPRYVLPVTAFAVFPAIAWACGAGGSRRRLMVLAAAAVLGVLVQLPAVLMRYDLYISEVGRTEITDFNPRFFPVAGQWRKLGEMSLAPLRGSLGEADIHDAAFKRDFARTPDFWFAYMWRLGMSRRLVLSALALLGAFLVGTACGLARCVRGAAPEASLPASAEPS